MALPLRSLTARLRDLGAAVLPGGGSLRKAEAGDQQFLDAFVALLAAALVPLFLTPFLPLCDLPINTASAELVLDTARGRTPPAHYYAVQWIPIPYWTSYALSAMLGAVFGPLLGAKLLTALVIALTPLGTMRLLLALGRDPRAGLWAFGLVWQQNLFAGWLAFMLGIALVFFVLAWMIEARSLRDAVKLAPFTALVALSHVQATLLLGLSAVALTLTTGRFWRRLSLHAVAGSGALAITAIWLGTQLRSAGGSSGADTLVFAWHEPSTKLSKLFHYTLDNFASPEAERAAALTFVVLLLGPLFLAQLPARAVRDRWSPFAIVAVAAALYAFLWWEVRGAIDHWYTYPRYAAVTLLALLLVPAPRLSGSALFALLPGFIAIGWIDVRVAESFAAFGERTRPFLQVLAAIPPRSSVLPLVFDDGQADLDFKQAPYHQFYAYVTAVGHGYSPYLWEGASAPLISKPSAALPSPGWRGAFSLRDHGKHYDYILVQGFQFADPVAPSAAAGDGPKLLLEAGRWRVYQVNHGARGLGGVSKR